MSGQKPQIRNRNYWKTKVEGRVVACFIHGNPHIAPWEVVYGGQQYAIAVSQPAALDELIRLQWAGILPEPEPEGATE